MKTQEKTISTRGKEEFENTGNDTIRQAQPIVLGEVIKGEVNKSYDSDFYEVTFAGKEIGVITVEPQNGYIVTVRVFDQYEDKLAEVDSLPGQTLIARVPVKKYSKYFIEVQAYGDHTPIETYYLKCDTTDAEREETSSYNDELSYAQRAYEGDGHD